MSHSKTTENYKLPLFQPTDRPAWLTDFNGAMQTVDETLKKFSGEIAGGGLPVSGGTMQGDIDMGDNAITNVQEVELPSSGDGLYIGSVVQPSGTEGARITGVAGGSVAVVKPDTQSEYVPVRVGSPTTDDDAATKGYIDSQTAGYLKLSGGTMTGDLKVQESPASSDSAVSKSYAQGLFGQAVNSSVQKTGGTMTGALTLSADPTEDLQAATKHYVDSKAGGDVLIGEYSFSPSTSNIQSITIKFPYNPELINKYAILLWSVTFEASSVNRTADATVELSTTDSNVGVDGGKLVTVAASPGSTAIGKSVMLTKDISSTTVFFHSAQQSEINNKIYFYTNDTTRNIFVWYSTDNTRTSDVITIRLYGVK